MKGNKKELLRLALLKFSRNAHLNKVGKIYYINNLEYKKNSFTFIKYSDRLSLS